MRTEATEFVIDPLIVVLDDDPAVLRSCLWALTAAGHRNLRLCSELETATVEWALVEADLLIWEVSLLGESGVHLLEQCRAHTPGAGFASVLAMISGDHMGRHEGIRILDDFLIKPIDSTELNWRVQHLLDLRAISSAANRSRNERPVRISDVAIKTATIDREALSEAKDSFIASVSHVLRTPLTAVLGFAYELADDADGLDRESIRDAAQLIAEQATDLSAIIDDLVVAARSDIDTVEILESEVDVIREVSVVLAGMSATDRVRIALPQGRLLVRADSQRVRHILRNLITNALRHGGQVIDVELGSHSGHGTVTVIDNGPGVPPGSWDRVFDPYFRLAGDTGQPHTVGLGLTVARLLARLMGGDVELVPRSGGTAFQLTLPGVASQGSNTRFSSNGHSPAMTADMPYEKF